MMVRDMIGVPEGVTKVYAMPDTEPVDMDVYPDALLADWIVQDRREGKL